MNRPASHATHPACSGETGGFFLRTWYHPPMRRRLFTLLSALSLLLCVGMVALWVRSYWVADHYSGHEERRIAPQVIGGKSVHLVYAPKPVVASERGWISFGKLAYDATDGQFCNFEPNSIYAIPYFIPVLTAAAIPLAWLWSRRTRWRSSKTDPNLCHHCGYDLRATHDRCPECGTVPAQTSCQSA